MEKLDSDDEEVEETTSKEFLFFKIVLRRLFPCLFRLTGRQKRELIFYYVIARKIVFSN